MNKKIVNVAVDAPLHRLFDYEWDSKLLAKEPVMGMLVEVEFGKKLMVGVVMGITTTDQIEQVDQKTRKLKAVIRVANIPPLNDDSLRLVRFTSKYYLKPLGEVVTSGIPAAWKKADRWDSLQNKKTKAANPQNHEKEKIKFELNETQAEVVNQLIACSNSNQYSPVLLKGITGSGKTAVYLNWIRHVLEAEDAQCLLLVPEINLTPQLETELKSSFPGKEVVVLHSGVTELKRAQAWLRAHLGTAKLIVGTRLSIMASIPHLKAIVVDEEHDASYKQQEGIRYSARDLAMWRASDLKIPIVLASATPSCETWQKSIDQKIKTLVLGKRAKPGSIEPNIQLIDIKQEKRLGKLAQSGLSEAAKKAIQETLAEGLQSLIFINRRGYAPVLNCNACGWKSSCPKCSSFLVLHKKNTLGTQSMLCCHHCGLVAWIPKKCPECGNQDISTLGNGTQKVEDGLEELFPGARVLRVDTDATRKKGSAKELFGKIHRGEVDIIVGTQMLSKGHDFESVDTVVVLDADSSLYSQDFRATEKLFAQMIQVAGRSGRSAKTKRARILIQTEVPEHELYLAVMNRDVDGYLNKIAQARSTVELPPYSNQALLLAEGRNREQVFEGLTQLKDQATRDPEWPKDVYMLDAISRMMAKIAGKERGQILIESIQRSSMQKALEILLGVVEAHKKKSRAIRYVIERDPSSY